MSRLALRPWLPPLAAFGIAYGAGSLPIGLVASRLWAGVDIRRYGTGNLGASNTFRNLGLGPAAVVGVGTFLQGFGPAWLAGRLTGSEPCRAAAAVGAVAGYGWSCLLGFRGGSAVGTATGALAALSPSGLTPLLGCYALGGALRRPAPGVLAGLLAYLATRRRLGPPPATLWAAAAIVGLVVLKRLEGTRGDLLAAGTPRVVWDRLVHDRRFGQRLVGIR